jgi:hypothetical protein
MPRQTRFRPEWIWLAALFGIMSLHFWFPRIGVGLGGDSYSATINGKKAFYVLMQVLSGDAVRSQEPLSSFAESLEPEATLCLLGPARYPTRGEWNRLLNWVSQGGRLVVAAGPKDFEFSFDPLGIEITAIDSVEREKKSDEGGEVLVTQLGEIEPTGLTWQSPAAIAPAEGGGETRKLVEWQGTVQAVARSYGTGEVIVVASDWVFCNESLATGNHDNSVLAVALLQAGRALGTVYLDESLNATGTPKVVGLLLVPPLRSLSVQLMIVLVLFGWWQSRRFGPLLPRTATARHNIVDHTDALGILYYKTGDGRVALQSYLRQLLTELGLTQSKGHEQRVLEPIARRLGQSESSLRQLLAQSQRGADAGRLARKDAATLIRQLATLRRAARRDNS